MSHRPRKAYHPHGRQNHHHQSRDEPPQRPPLLSALLLKALWLLLLVMFGNTPDVEELIKLETIPNRGLTAVFLEG